jgi:hypothetical protein
LNEALLFGGRLSKYWYLALPVYKPVGAPDAKKYRA